MTTPEISNDVLVRALRIYERDLNDGRSRFNKTPGYLHDLAGWVACAAARIEELSGKEGA